MHLPDAKTKVGEVTKMKKSVFKKIISANHRFGAIIAAVYIVKDSPYASEKTAQKKEENSNIIFTQTNH